MISHKAETLIFATQSKVNMKKYIKNAGLLIALLFTLVSFNACTEDDYIEMDLVGNWRVVEVRPIHGQCPYRNNDYMEFHSDGYFYADLGGYNDEHGEWWVRHGSVFIDFDGYGGEEMRAYVRQHDYDYIVLDVEDYDFNSRYTLRLLKY